MRWIDPTTKRKFESKIHAGDTALLTNFWVGRPTTPLTQDRFLERQTILPSGVTKTSITVSHPAVRSRADRIYVAYISNGQARVKSAAYKAKMQEHVWVDEAFATAAEDVAICFDSRVKTSLDGTEEFVTQGSPWVFWVHDSVLTARRLGYLGEVVLASANCSAVSAVRAAYSDMAGIDFGLVVFFVINGAVYYRQLIDNEWKDAELITHTPEGETIVDIAAFRTWDYRIGIQLLTSTGKIYALISQYQGIAKHNSEHISLNLASSGGLIAVQYTNEWEREHISLRVAAGAPYGGLYHIGVPEITAAYNLPDESNDWGHIAVFVFDHYLVASEVASQASAFSIVDSRNRQFVASTATLGADGKTVTLTFADFNAANGVCDATYIAGTVHSMAGTSLIDKTYAFTPQNLVAPQDPIPEVESITNVGYEVAGLRRVRFYSVNGQTLLETEFVALGEDTEYGANEVWALTANTGTAVAHATEDITANKDLYLARWTVQFFSTDGLTLLNSEFVKDGEDAAGGEPEQITPDTTSGPTGTTGTWTGTGQYDGYYTTENIENGYFLLEYDTPFSLSKIVFQCSPINGAQWVHYLEYHDVTQDQWIAIYTSESAEGTLSLELAVAEHPIVDAVRWRTTTKKVYPYNIRIPVFYTEGILAEDVWALTPNSGISVPNITKHVSQNLNLYLARWAVTYYSTDGTDVLYKEYVVNGEDAVWGANREWSDSAEGTAVIGILENITANISVYRVISQGSYLPSSNAENIICEAFADNFDASALAWGIGVNPVQFSTSGATKQNGAVLIPVRSSGTLAYVDLGENNTPFTAYIVCKLVNPSTYSRILSAMAARSAGQGILLYGSTVTVSSWANDTSTGVSASATYFAAAIKFGGSSNSGGFVNSGNYIGKPPSVANRYLTIARTDINPSTSNAEPCDILVKYLGVVKEAETETVMRSNIQNLITEFMN